MECELKRSCIRWYEELADKAIAQERQGILSWWDSLSIIEISRDAINLIIQNECEIHCTVRDMARHSRLEEDYGLKITVQEYRRKRMGNY